MLPALPDGHPTCTAGLDSGRLMERTLFIKTKSNLAKKVPIHCCDSFVKKCVYIHICIYLYIRMSHIFKKSHLELKSPTA